MFESSTAFFKDIQINRDESDLQSLTKIARCQFGLGVEVLYSKNPLTQFSIYIQKFPLASQVLRIFFPGKLMLKCCIKFVQFFFLV